MARIAIIDDKINSNLLVMGHTIEYIFISEEKESEVNTCTHSTIIARILENYAEEYELVNIVLTNNINKNQHIKRLEKALKICLWQKVDIICMSLGTEIISEGRYLVDVIKELYQNGIIMIAAADNEENYILPAFFSEVISVGVDKKNSVFSGEYIYMKENFLNINILANCDLKSLFSDRILYPSTSYAVPVIVAKVNNIINQGFVGQTYIRKVLLKEAKLVKEYTFEKRHIKVDLPIVVSDDLSKIEWEKLMNYMAEKYKVESIGIDFLNDTKDFRFFPVKNDFDEVISFIESYTRADIIVIALNKREVEYDIKVVKEDGKYRCIVLGENDEEIYFTIKEIGDSIIRHLC